MQGTAGMHSASLAEVPMVIMSGELLTFGENPGLDIEPQWYRSLSIVGGTQRLVEPVTKWATQVGSVHTLYESVVRASEYAQRTPAGPVYLNVPLETMLQDWTPPAHPRTVPPAPKTQAKAADVARIADLLVKAKSPMIITDTVGRDPKAFAALVELAELFGIPVGGGRGTAFANFPKNHPLHMGYGLDRHLKEADLVLVICCRAPWYPPSRKPTTGTIVAIDENPLKGMMVYQSLQADHYLEGEVASSLRLLVEAGRAAGVGAGKHADRRDRWKREHDKMVADELAAEAKARGAGTIEPLALIDALRDGMPSDTVYVEETITHAGLIQQHLPWAEPQSYFRVGGGLGQGLGVALGVKLATPKRPVALLVGDGSFLYNPVIQAFGAAKGNSLPILVVVFNNRKYHAMQKGHLHHYPDGVALGADMFHGVHIDGPDYAELGKPFGFHGQKVEKPGELKGAVQGALRALKDGKSAILNVCLS